MLKTDKSQASPTWLAYLRLMRPPNLVTAAADILAGSAAAGAMPHPPALLVFSSVALYAGGVTFNDIFDAKLDRIERPERPIPSDVVSLTAAALLGSVLLAAGIGMAWIHSPLSAGLAAAIALMALLYDARGKHSTWGGPPNMAACRALNLLLGLTAAPDGVSQRWYLSAIPFVYITAITLLSRGEVHGGRRRVSLVCFVMVAAVIAGLLALGLTPGFAILTAAPFIVLLAWRVIPAFWRAVGQPEPATIRRAIMAGVLSVVVLDSAVVGGYAGILSGTAVWALSLLAGGMARLFAVT